MLSLTRKPLSLILSLLGCLFMTSPLQALEPTIPTFQELLTEAGLELSVPDGFNEIELKKIPLLQHEKAIRSADGKLELRYVIRPLSRIEIDYSDPHSAVPEPNHMFNMLFHTMIGNLTKRGSRSPTKEYSQAQAKEFFNADWAALGVFDVVPEYSGQYSQVMLLAMHKNDLADAYTVFLFNDYAEVKETVQQSMDSLKFSQ